MEATGQQEPYSLALLTVPALGRLPKGKGDITLSSAAAPRSLESHQLCISSLIRVP